MDDGGARRAAGRPAAEARFRSLFDRCRGDVLAYALRRVRHPADAADVLSETFLVAWRRLDDVPPGDEVAWLIGVARNVLRNVERGRVRRGRLADRLRDDLSRLPVPESPAGPGPNVHGALLRLSSADRELLQLVAWEGLTPAQLATALRLPPATVRQRLSRARTRLRRELDVSRDSVIGHDGSDGQPLVTRRGRR